MSFDDDNSGKPFVADPEYVFTRPAARVVVSGPDGTPQRTFEVPELKLTREQVSPEWLALHDAEQKEPG